MKIDEMSWCWEYLVFGVLSHRDYVWRVISVVEDALSFAMESVGLVLSLVVSVKS